MKKSLLSIFAMHFLVTHAYGMHGLGLGQMIEEKIASHAELDQPLNDDPNSAQQKLLHRTCMDDSTVELTDKLLKAGANPNIEDQAGETPLHYACTFSTITNIEVLLKNKANPNLITKRQSSPLALLYTESATASEVRMKKIKTGIKLLLFHGTDISQPNCFGKTLFKFIYDQSHDPLSFANITASCVYTKHLLQHKPAYLHLLISGDSVLAGFPRDILRLIINELFPDYPWPKENYEQLVAQFRQAEKEDTKEL